MSQWFDAEVFEHWFAQMLPEPDASAAPGEARAWFLRVFKEHGPANREIVDMVYELDQLAMAEAALVKVLADLDRTSMLRPEVTIDNYGQGILITVDGSYNGPSVDERPVEQPILRQVAEYVQDRVMSNHLLVWPSCPLHDAGLHAELIDGVATWRCHISRHDVATVGQLGAD